MSKEKVLVTGSEGFIGSHLVERLVKRGYTVRAFVLYNSFGSFGWLDNLPNNLKENVEIVLGDVRDYDSVSKAVSGCDAIIHLASLIAIPYSYEAPHSYLETNSNGTLNVLRAAKRFECQKLIHTSTSEVYGTALHVPISEVHPLQPQSPYAASKASADLLALSFFKSFELPLKIVRPFNTYGPRQSNRAIIPTIISQLLSGSKRIELGLLTPTRDLTYVEDTVDGFIAALASESGFGEVVNIGSNFEISMQNLVNLIGEICDVDIEIVTKSQRLRPAGSEVERLWCDNQKAKRVFDWEPRHEGIEGLKVGLKKTVEWFQIPGNLDLYKPRRYIL